ncbi:MAG: hypothetical protein ACYDBW_02795 [Sulfuricaulis sp.]
MPLKKELGFLLVIGAFAAVIYGPLWWRPVSPCVAGDLAARARATVPEALKAVYLDAEKMQFGMGSAAIGDWRGLGDALAAGGRVWVRTTNARSPKYYATVSNRYFLSNGFVYISPGLAGKARWLPHQPTTLTQLWATLAQKNPAGVMFAGYVRLAPLQLIAIAQPAIDGRPVLKNAAHYYTRPMESAPRAWAYVVGLAAADTAVTRPDRDWLTSLLATPADRGGSAPGMAYALWLKSAPADLHSPPGAENVNNVGQLVADSQIVEGELKLYPMTRAGHCDAVARND